MANRVLRSCLWSILFVAALPGLTRLGQAQERFNMSHSALTGSQAILFVTRDAGIFRKHNLEPQIIYITGAPPNIAALLAGSLDFVVFAGPAAITANLAGANTAVLMSFVNTMEHSIFSQRAIKNPADIKGKTIGGAQVSDKHANFIVNTGHAKAADVLALMEIVKNAVLEQRGVRLEPEIKIIGED